MAFASKKKAFSEYTNYQRYLSAVRRPYMCYVMALLGNNTRKKVSILPFKKLNRAGPGWVNLAVIRAAPYC